MSVMLATLCLNEMEWLNKLWDQHKDWPELERWVFVEAADAAYARANPSLVSGAGLSVDGTNQFLEALATLDSRVQYIPFGLSSHADPALCKAAARQAYLDVAEEVRPEFLIQLDADEFYTRAHQQALLGVMRSRPEHRSFVFHRREIWYPPYLRERGDSLLGQEVVGGFWKIPCCHWFRWAPGMNHRRDHITPYDCQGRPYNDTLCRVDEEDQAGKPQMVHLGFASRRETRVAKNTYYAQRGEANDRQRRWYVESRAAWETWQPGVCLPRDARIVGYTGPIPECFKETR